MWDRDDYIKEAEKQFGDKDIYEEMCKDPRFLIRKIIRKIGELNADTIK